MKRTIISIVSLAALLITMGCEKNEPNLIRNIKGTGDIISLNLNVESFNNIRHIGVGDIKLTVGNQQSVKLEAQQNIIDVMTWEVINHEFHIGIEDNIHIEESERIQFTVTIPKLEKIRHEGIGDIILAGATQQILYLDFSGIGTINANDLNVNECYLIFSGTGDCHVNVNNLLDITMTGIGNVYYKGNPEIVSTLSGLGDLVNDN